MKPTRYARRGRDVHAVLLTVQSGKQCVQQVGLELHSEQRGNTKQRTMQTLPVPAWSKVVSSEHGTIMQETQLHRAYSTGCGGQYTKQDNTQ
jgi:hypothetical protein